MKKNNSKTKKVKEEIEVIEEETVVPLDKQEEVIEEEIKKIKKNSGKQIINNIFLILAFLTFTAYIVIEIMHYDSFLNFMPKLLGMGLIFLFLICFIVMSVKNKGKVGSILGCLIIILYSIFNILLTMNIINLPSDEYVPNFYNKALKEVNEWKDKNNIQIIENYEYSDIVAKFNIISQDITYPELTKNIETLTLNISLGPDPEKQIIIPNFIGKNVNDVLKYVDENYLSNVTILYEVSEKSIDTVISQNVSGTLKRSSPITFTIARSDEVGEIEIPDFTNKKELETVAWLQKNGFKYNITYEFSDEIEEGYVIKQDVKNEVKNPETDTINIVISVGKMKIAPDILGMKQDDINEWIMDNNLKVVYEEAYSDTVKLGDVISSSIQKDDVIDKDEEIKITISKGVLAMINLTNVNDFTNWAETNNVDYEINYEYSNTYKKDEIIKCSHKTGETIKKDDTVIVTVSSGKSIAIPNFIGMDKTSIQNKCKEINLNCSFKTGSYTENTKKDIAISQSKKSNTTVSEGTSLVITLSAGIIQKVNVPSFKGKTKSAITAECKNLGITCSFKYQSGYSNDVKDTCVSQSKTGTVNKGSSITITLSNGPAKTYTVIIDANQLSSGNPAATKATLQSKLKSACPGVTFNFKFEKANSGIGYLAPTSQVKVGSNTFTQGKTYTVIINSN